MKRPNILFILTDQQRYDTIGANGNPRIFTPHLDRLSAQGMVFQRAYCSSPECVPARAVIMTGRPVHQTGCFSNSYSLDPRVPTFQRLLRQAGYLTQAIGKMHFKPTREGFGMERLCLSEEIPSRVEEDEFLQELHAAGFGWAEEPHGMRSHMYYVPQVSQLPDHWHTTTWTGRKTVEFIESQRGGAQPWLCWAGFMKPHPPFDPTVPFNTLYDPVEMPLPVRGPQCRANRNWYQTLQNRGKWMDLDPDLHLVQAQKAHYWACVSMIDRQVGRMLDALERTSQRDDTLVVFTTDHGELLGDHHSWGKRSWYEGSARVPFIVSWPGRIKQGQRRDHLVNQTDILPTFLAAAGMDAPSWAPGVNLLELCRDDAARSREFLIGQLGEKGLALYLAMDAEWKYAYCAADGKEQLFHYASDPDELVNRASDLQAAEAKARLFGALVDYWRRDGYEDPAEDGAWRRWPRGTSGLERLLEGQEGPYGISGGYRQYAAWNKRADNVFRPEGRLT